MTWKLKWMNEAGSLPGKRFISLIFRLPRAGNWVCKFKHESCLFVGFVSLKEIESKTLFLLLSINFDKIYLISLNNAIEYALSNLFHLTAMWIIFHSVTETWWYDKYPFRLGTVFGCFHNYFRFLAFGMGMLTWKKILHARQWLNKFVNLSIARSFCLILHRIFPFFFNTFYPASMLVQ